MKLFRDLKFNHYQADHASSMDHRMSDAKKCHEGYQKALRHADRIDLFSVFVFVIFVVFLAFSMVGLAVGVNLFASTAMVYIALTVILIAMAFARLRADFRYWMWRQSLSQADAGKDD